MKKKSKFLVLFLALAFSCVGLVACGGGDEPPHVHSYTSETTLSATCTTTGTIKYTCTCGDSYEDTIPATGHSITHHELIEPTCTTDGNLEYWSCANCNTKYSDETAQNVLTTSVTLPAFGHNAVDEPVWTWTEAFTASAKFVCAICETEMANIAASNVYYETSTYPTCTEEGVRTYRAYVNYEGDSYYDSKDTPIAATNHRYNTEDEPTWTWTGYTEAKAAFSCVNSNCSHKEEVVATAITDEVTTETSCYSAGVITYTASVTFNDTTYTDEAYESIDMTSHNYEVDESGWRWNRGQSSEPLSNDYYTAQAKLKCSNSGCSSYKYVDATVTAEETTKLTCTQRGEITYTATYVHNEETFTNSDKTYILYNQGHQYEDTNICTACNAYYLNCNYNSSLQCNDVTNIYSPASTVTKIYIPATYNGLPVRVTSFGTGTSNTEITEIYLEEGIEFVSLNSLSTWGHLNVLSIPSTITEISLYASSASDILDVLTLHENGYYVGNELNPYFALITVEDTTITSFSIHEDTVMVMESALGYDKKDSNKDPLTFPALASVSIGKNATNISKNFFTRCDVLENITLHADNSSYAVVGNILYNKDITDIHTVPAVISGDVVIPDTVTGSIPDYAFYGTNITSFDTGDGVTSLGSNVGSNCDLLKTVIIGDNVTTLGTSTTPGFSSNGVFIDCNLLESFTLGANVEFLGESSFCFNPSSFSGETQALKEVNVKNLANFIEIYGSSFSSTHLTLKVDGEVVTDLVIPTGVTAINAHLAGYDIINVTIPNTVTTIGASVFYDNDSIVGVYIPASVTTIGNGAFYNCNASVIRCEVAEKPSGWSNEWCQNINSGYRCVIWDCLNNDYDEYNEANIIQVGNLRYYIDKEAKTAELYRQSTGLKGKIIIPTSITYKDETYNVSIIGTMFVDNPYITEIEITHTEHLTKIYGPASSCDSFENVSFIGTEAEWNSLIHNNWSDYPVEFKTI